MYFSSPDSSRDDDDNLIYKANRYANFTVLILQGRALVETSTEHLLFEAGPFMLFGETVLKCELARGVVLRLFRGGGMRRVLSLAGWGHGPAIGP